MMKLLALLPFLLQSIAILIDEFYFHWKRGLPRWERIGHPLDTLSVFFCFAFSLFFPYDAFHLKIYIALALFSCLLVTKDEFVHKECCPAAEQWLHALLFLNHPLVLLILGFLWASPPPFDPYLKYFLFGQCAFIAAFALYQLIYWNFIWQEKQR